MAKEELENLKSEIKELQTIRNAGMSPLSYLGISLIVLKVANLVTWSWWLVLAPFYVSYLLSLILAIPLSVKIISYAKKLAALREEAIKNGTNSDVTDKTEEVITIPIVIDFTEMEVEPSNPGVLNTTTENTEKPKKAKKINKKKREDNGEKPNTAAEKPGHSQESATTNN